MRLGLVLYRTKEFVTEGTRKTHLFLLDDDDDFTDEAPRVMGRVEALSRNRHHE